MTAAQFFFGMTLIFSGLAAYFYVLYDNVRASLKDEIDRRAVAERHLVNATDRVEAEIRDGALMELREQQLARALEELANAEIGLAKSVLKIVYG